MLSFNLDYIERERKLGNNDGQLNLNKQENINGADNPPTLLNLDDRQRLSAPLPLDDYNVSNYIAYISYTPLFIAGPIITFNDYVYQSNYQQSSTTQNYQRIFMYAIRFLFCLLVMEFYYISCMLLLSLKQKLGMVIHHFKYLCWGCLI